MPPIESRERPPSDVDVAQETEKRIKGLETLVSMMKKSAPIQPQADIPELNSAKWDLKNVIVLKDYYFVLSNDGRDMQVLLIDQNGEMSVDTTVPKYIKDAATFKIHAMRGTSPVPSPPRAPAPSPSRAPAAAPRAKREAPAPAPARAQEERREVAPTAGSIEEMFEEFKNLSLSVNGDSVRVTLDSRLNSVTGMASYLRKNSVPIARYESYLRSMNDQKKLLETALSNMNRKYAVEWKGDHFEAKTPGYRIRTTATDVFMIDGRTNIEKSLLSNRTVSRTPKATGTEYKYGDGTREYHRTDGIQYREKSDGTRQFFDGSNMQPVMEKTGTGVNVFGPDGDKVDAIRRPTESDVKRYADDIAKKLKTPEAIAAFVSQFYLSHEYKTSPDNAQWLREIQKNGANPVAYKGESGGNQEVQRWDDTLIKGSGDCEDYALLAQELLERAGVKAFCMKVSTVHYEAVYFEPAGVNESGQKQFHVCNLGLSGFKRSTQTFTSLPEAAKSLAIGSVASDGVHILEMPTKRVDSETEEGVIPLSGAEAEKYYKYFVRK